MLSLTDKELEKARKHVKEAVRPLIFFHDDPDGLASFLLLYRKIGEGKGVPIKTTPVITTDFLRFVEEYQPDRLFIVDIAVVEQDFLDEVKCPVIWIDHHEPLERDRVTYFNPRKHHNENIPASQVCYDIVQQDEWIAMIGIVGDWVLPRDAKEFSKNHPDLLPPETSRPEDALFNTKLGELTNMFSFLLKGKMSDVRKSINVISRIESAEELFDAKTPRSKMLNKRFAPILNEYKSLLKLALDARNESPILEYLYGINKWSFTKEISNETFYHNSDKFVMIGRERDGVVKLSLRYAGNIPEILNDAMNGLDARGGGHEHACGAVVAKDDYQEFKKRILEAISPKSL